jgi:tetratricopeptide (TPR) repeat protein
VKGSCAAVLIAFQLFGALAAQADDAAQPNVSATPWVDDLALINQTTSDIKTGGILAVERHREQLEKALAGARHSIDLAGAARPTSYVLTDGPADTLAALVLATADKSSGLKNTVAVQNPYPSISFYLGSYYDEVERPQDALRVLDAGLALSTLPDLDAGETRAVILLERGSALMALHRWQDVMQNEDRGLKMSDLDNKIKAHFYRGRGYALTELNQLDDAEEAYKESLNLEPGNQRAESELKYIAGLKLGAPRAAPGQLNKVQKIPPAEPASSANP